MKYLLMLLFILACCTSTGQTTQSPEQIRQEMARIRQTTNWDDPAAAAKANEQIKALARKLMSASPVPGSQGQQQQTGPENPKDAQKMSDLNREMIEQRMDIWSQIWKSAAGGEGADILLAEPLRDKIVEEFRQNDQQSINPVFAEELNLLVINLSMPGVESVIESMPNFRGIQTLIVEAGQQPDMFLLGKVMRNSKDYPLECLSIINFGNRLDNIPDQVYAHNKLRVMHLYNNAIKVIPPEIRNLSGLKELYIDMNPVAEALPWISALKNLEKIGVAKTSLSQTDLDDLRKLLPDCQILEK